MLQFFIFAVLMGLICPVLTDFDFIPVGFLNNKLKVVLGKVVNMGRFTKSKKRVYETIRRNMNWEIRLVIFIETNETKVQWAKKVK